MTREKRRPSGGFFDLDAKEKEIAELETRAHAPGFWNDNIAARKVMQRLTERKSWTEEWGKIRRRIDDVVVLIDLGEEAGDPSVETEIAKEFAAIEKELADLEFRNMLSGEDDPKNCILTIHAGAGGTEAQDWAEMLMRMYLRWCERRGYKTFLLDEQAGEGAGLKSVDIEVQGAFAYGYLKAENGVHRLVRISP
ncbi:MAG TPA: PCRF domain-containing protein, partial [Bacteroidota bacterium]|nr:PCRF domain-containing protein [Bacteroidota bacterium]